jgi:serine/threonine-protein kinase RsbT
VAPHSTSPADEIANERFDVRVPVDALWCSLECRRFAAALGFDRRSRDEIGIAVRELATNAVVHGHGGSLTLRARARRRGDGAPGGIEVVVKDRGPGIADPAHATRDGVSRGRCVAGEQFDPARESLGVGLGAVLRLMDELELSNRTGGGLVATARKHLGGVPDSGG